MTISLRLNKDEEKRLEQMKRSTGLTTTALVKKGLFDTQENQFTDKNMLIKFCKISTKFNLLECDIKNENYTEALNLIKEMEKELMNNGKSEDYKK